MKLKIERTLGSLIGLKGNQVYLSDRVTQYEHFWQQISSALGANIEKLDRDMWEISRGSSSSRVRLHELPLDNNIVLKMCGRKPLVHRLLAENDIPIPAYTTFSVKNSAGAFQFLSDQANSCVVKPCVGYSGLGVTTHITNRDELEKAIALASLYHDDLMIEEQIVGENYRILVYKGRILHAVRRTGDYVVGDGVSTLQQLLGGDPIDHTDRDFHYTLAAQGRVPSTVLEDGERLMVRSIGSGFNGGKELRTVYDTDVTSMVHPSVLDDAISCAHILRSSLVGIDVISKDISRNLRETGGVINEANTTPALHHHYDSSTEAYPGPAFTIMQDLLA